MPKFVIFGPIVLELQQNSESLGGSLATRAKGPGFKPPVSRTHLDICLSGLYVWRDWFLGIESGRDPVERRPWFLWT